MSVIEGTHLGKTSTYKTTYDPSLLVAVPRQENRDGINITKTSLPFCGFDVWNAYEVSCLNHDGKPIAGIAKIVYSADSDFLVESKSLKLYLNSFNMEKIKGATDTDVRDELATIIVGDLSTILKTAVSVSVFAPLSVTERNSSFNLNAQRMMYLDSLSITPTVYNESPSSLRWETFTNPTLLTEKPKIAFYRSELLRSNCKITKQPDWGTTIIGITPNKKVVDPASLLEYIVSFRNENHFHEEICETIYKRLHDLIEPAELLVACFYTRRGGIDINPIRASHMYLLNEYCADYLNSNSISYKFLRQ